MRSPDQELIAQIDESVRRAVNEAMQPEIGALKAQIEITPPGNIRQRLENKLAQMPLPPGFPCHRSRVGAVRRCWEVARETHLKATGIDVLGAIKRHEAWLRSPENAPELHVQRR